MSAGMIECWMERDLEALYRDLCSLKQSHFYARDKEEKYEIECDIFVVGKIIENKIKIKIQSREEQAKKNVVERVEEEREELKVKLDKLNSFLDKVFIEHTIFITETQAHYLKEQREYMQGYLEVLNKRLEDFKEKRG